MWAWIVGLAWAGAPKELQGMAEAGADFGLACTSAAEGSALLGRVKAVMDQRRPHPISALPDTLRTFLGGGLTRGESGGDGPMRAAMWMEAKAFEVSVGTDVGEEELARRLAAEVDGAPVPDGAHWVVRRALGRDMYVRVQDGWGTISNVPVPPAAARSAAADLAHFLPDAPGCAILGRFPLPDDSPATMAAFFPYHPGEVLGFVVASPRLEALDGVLPRPVAPREVRTAQAPEVVVVVGVGLDGVNFSRFLQGKDLANMRRVQRWLPISAGGVVAGFGGAEKLELAAVLPFAHPVSPERTARRLKTLLATRPSVIEHEGVHVSLLDPGLTLRFAVQKDALLVAGTAERLAELEAGGSGGAWVGPEVAALAGRYPVVLSASALRGADGARTLPVPAYLGVTLEPGVVRGELSVPMPFVELDAVIRAMEAQMKEDMDAAFKGDGGP